MKKKQEFEKLLENLIADDYGFWLFLLIIVLFGNDSNLFKEK